jgi:hypothetical protein
MMVNGHQVSNVFSEKPLTGKYSFFVFLEEGTLWYGRFAGYTGVRYGGQSQEFSTKGVWTYIEYDAGSYINTYKGTDGYMNGFGCDPTKPFRAVIACPRNFWHGDTGNHYMDLTTKHRQDLT